MVIYLCTECCNPFCAGRTDCIAAFEEPATESFRCPSCDWLHQQSHRGWGQECLVHGSSFALYKCDYCCNPAVWDCGGTHFCDRCHCCDGTYYPCPGPELCPLGIPHLPNDP